MTCTHDEVIQEQPGEWRCQDCSCLFGPANRNTMVYDVTNLKTLQYFADTAADDEVSFVNVRTKTLLDALEFVWELLPSYLNPASDDWDRT